MQILSFAPTGPWPELGTCPCCGQPWPPIGPDPHPFIPPDLDFPEPFHYDPEPSPYVVEVPPEPEVFKLAVSGVSLEFLLFLEGTR